MLVEEMTCGPAKIRIDVLGETTREHVLDIWNGELNRRYRGLLAEGRRSELLLCSNCEAYKTHHFDGFPAPALAQA